jgi:hypothetical protein
MPVVATPIFPQAIRNAVQAIANADGTTIKTLVTAGANGSRIYAISITSTDTAARDLNLYVAISGTNYLIGTVSVPVNAGNTNAIMTVDLLRSAQLPFLAFDVMGNRVLDLASGSSLAVGATTTVTTAKQVTIVIQFGDF